MPAETQDELLTAEQVTQFLKVPRSWVYERCREGSLQPLPHIKLGKYLRFYKSDLLHYVETLRRSGDKA